MSQYDEYADEQLNNAIGMTGALVPDGNSRIFGAWCNAEWLNQQKVLNNTMFFTFAPAPFLTYYWTIVKRNLEWYNGYVFGIHNQGILSSRVGSVICDMAAELTLSGGWRFKGDKTAKAFMLKFMEKKRILHKLKTHAPILNAIGFALAKIDIDSENKLDINYVDGNRYFAQVDSKGNVTACVSQILFITAEVKRCEENRGNSRGYYLVEERFYKKSKPCIRYRIYEGPELATAPTTGAEVDAHKGIPFEALPPHAKRAVRREIGKIELNKTYYLPFKHLGAVILLNTESATGMNEYKCFSDSTLAKCGEAMYEFDLTLTQKEESKYLSVDFAAVPDEMWETSVPFGGDAGKAYAMEMATEARSGLDKRIVKSVRYIDPTKATPFIYQTQLKTDAYGAELDRILNRVAMGANFAPVTLAGFLHNGVEKTATEVTADENSTRRTIKTKRGLLADAHNVLIEEILRYYGVTDEGKPGKCVMVFNEGALSNPYQEVNYIAALKDAGLIDWKTAIGKANPDLDEEAINAMYENIKQEQKEQQAQPFGDLNNLNLGI